MTKRATEQKDDGEPAFSPDGRYLYWSEDSTPGKIFEYNKDPNGQIYVIKRLDRQTGKIVHYVTGPGGSIRPTPSPDGKSLAFIRRVRYKSTLFVKDIESGVERPIWDGLERDMQETWAIQGVYPGMAWTPDSKRVVVLVRRQDPQRGPRGQTGRRDPVPRPRHPQDGDRSPLRRRRADGPDAGLDVATGPPPPPPGGEGRGEGERSPSACSAGSPSLRTASASPTRRSATSTSATSPTALPNASRRRPTTSSSTRRGRATASPSSTRPGTTTRSARSASPPSRRAPPASSRTSPATTSSPSSRPTARGSSTRRGPAAYLRSTAWSADPGLYVGPVLRREVDARGRGRASRPRFGKASDRVFFVKTEGGGDQIAPEKRILASIKLDGSDVHEYYLSELAQEFEVSPDGKWLAFPRGLQRLRHALRRDRTPRRHRPQEQGRARHEGLEGRRREPPFSGDSARLYWSFGPQLFERGPQGRVRVPARRAGEAARVRRSSAATSASTPPSTSPAAPSPSRAAASSR